MDLDDRYETFRKLSFHYMIHFSEFPKFILIYLRIYLLLLLFLFLYRWKRVMIVAACCKKKYYCELEMLVFIFIIMKNCEYSACVFMANFTVFRNN